MPGVWNEDEPARNGPETIAASLLRALHDREAGRVRTPPEDIAESAPAKLSRREAGFVHLLRRGLSNQEIARQLDISVATVKHHVHSILDTLGYSGCIQVARAEPDSSWGLNGPGRDDGLRALKRA